MFRKDRTESLPPARRPSGRRPKTLMMIRQGGALTAAHCLDRDFKMAAAQGRRQDGTMREPAAANRAGVSSTNWIVPVPANTRC